VEQPLSLPIGERLNHRRLITHGVNIVKRYYYDFLVLDDCNYYGGWKTFRRGHQPNEPPHAFEHPAKVAVASNDSSGVVLESGACYVETAEEQVNVLRVGRAAGVGINFPSSFVSGTKLSPVPSPCILSGDNPCFGLQLK
jgi:hypothetical protein